MPLLNFKEESGDMSDENLRLKTTDELIQVIVDLNTKLSEREAVIAEREAEIKSLEWQMSKRLVDKLSFDEFETLRKEKDSEIAALKSKLGEAEKALVEADRTIRKNGDDGWKFGQRALEMIGKALSSLRTHSDGEGKS